MRTPNHSSPLEIVAIGVAAAAVLWGIAQIVPPIFEGIGVVIKAIGAAGGLAVAVGTTGFSTAGTVATWLAPVAAAGVAATGVGVTYIVLHVVVVGAKEKPYEWLLPALGLLAVLFVDLSKDELLATNTERALYALVTGGCVIGGGALLLNRRCWVRAIGFFVPFLPTFVVWAAFVHKGHIDKGLSDFIRSGYAGALGLVGVLSVGAIVALIGIALPKR
ncbi:MAG: hypothetical protein LCH73_10010 [Proteobacteria bacterium]|nr:hypothetical protein [Pseudomonadota bacterium]